MDYYSFADRSRMEGWVVMVGCPIADTLSTKYSHSLVSLLVSMYIISLLGCFYFSVIHALLWLLLWYKRNYQQSVQQVKRNRLSANPSYYALLFFIARLSVCRFAIYCLLSNLRRINVTILTCWRVSRVSIACRVCVDNCRCYRGVVQM